MYLVSETPIDIEKVIRKIRLHGGYVCADFDEANTIHCDSQQTSKKSTNQTVPLREFHDRLSLPAASSPIHVLCMSHTYACTAKYLQCLAAGIPCVNLSWVDSSIGLVNQKKIKFPFIFAYQSLFSQKQCANWFKFLLPSGYSKMIKDEMEQSYANDLSPIPTQRLNFLEGTNVFLATSSNKEWTDLWLKTLTLCGATVTHLPPSGGEFFNVFHVICLLIRFSFREIDAYFEPSYECGFSG